LAFFSTSRPWQLRKQGASGVVLALSSKQRHADIFIKDFYLHVGRGKPLLEPSRFHHLMFHMPLAMQNLRLSCSHIQMPDGAQRHPPPGLDVIKSIQNTDRALPSISPNSRRSVRFGVYADLYCGSYATGRVRRICAALPPSPGILYSGSSHLKFSKYSLSPLRPKAAAPVRTYIPSHPFI